ncbi:hypothetical protein ACIBK8_33510 [Streptomyces sp. NPDC050161]|uniref:hypothetical protein n=1 Tax=Streptomyces sp. NPDC050161 TaxID=3365604 RepID=UPI003794AD4F
MSGKQIWTAAVLVTVFAWSTVMTALGQLTAMAALLPSLGMLVQQIAAALNGTETRRDVAAGRSPAAAVGAAGREESHR